MSLKTGIFDIGGLLKARNLSAVAIGLDTVQQVLAQDNERFNAIVQGALADVCAISSDRQRVAGSSIGGDMLETDEYSRGPTQSDIPSYLLGFPMRKYQFAVGWTRQWIKKATGADFAVRQQAAQGADLRRLQYELKKAIFTPTNSSFIDKDVDKATLAVKAFMNADGSPVQNGPNGEIFDGTTHTHYLGSATLTAAAVQLLISDVVEHGYGSVKVYINVANSTAFQALAGFVPLQVPYVTINAAANQVASPRLDIGRADNRQIGYFGAAEVWTKPWVPANYALAIDTVTEQKPLVMRVDDPNLGLHVEAEIETYPLQAQYQEHSYGFGCWNRLAAAALEFDNAVYGAPALTY